MLPEPFVDFHDEPNEELNRYTNQIIGAAIEVHRELGAGYAEAIYQKHLSWNSRPAESCLNIRSQCVTEAK